MRLSCFAFSVPLFFQAYMDEGAALAFKQSEMEKTVRKARGQLRGVQEERDSLAQVRRRRLIVLFSGCTAAPRTAVVVVVVVVVLVFVVATVLV